MSPQLSADEIDDLLYLARTGENDELAASVTQLAEREKASSAEVFAAAQDERSTCLHMASGNGHLATVTLLLAQFTNRPPDEKRAFIDAQNEYGNTGLHWAALGGHLDIVKRLVESGASPAVANDQNYIPLDLALLNERTAVVDYFLSTSSGLDHGNARGGGLEGAAEGIELKDPEEFEEEGRKNKQGPAGC